MIKPTYYIGIYTVSIMHLTIHLYVRILQVWGLTVHSLLYSFPGEHPRSSFFKNIGQVSFGNILSRAMV